MAESHVISGLVSKRSELAGLLSHYRKEISKISEELSHIDHTIKIFNPEYDLRAIRTKQYRKKNKFFKKGEGNRVVLEVLRDSKESVSTLKVAQEVIKRKSFDLNDDQTKALQSNIVTLLNRQYKDGIVEKTKDSNGCFWSIASFKLGG